MKIMNSIFGSRYYYYPRKQAHMALFKINHGYEMNWNNPQTMDEKIHKLICCYGKNESIYADKIKVREYVLQSGFGNLLPNVYGIWDNVNKIEYVKLPNRFVLKTNHASGSKYIVFCKDKENFNYKDSYTLQKAIHINFAKQYCEYQYAYIRPFIYAEEYLCDGFEKRMIDYKVHCFEGNPYCIQVISNRANGEILHNVFNFEWQELDYVRSYVRSSKAWTRPQSLNIMYQASKCLSEPFKYARIDFYDVHGKAYFGEITLSPAGGNLLYFNEKAQVEMGKLIDL